MYWNETDFFVIIVKNKRSETYYIVNVTNGLNTYNTIFGEFQLNYNIE